MLMAKTKVAASSDGTIGRLAAASIGLGGIVGGGIFAVLGLAVAEGGGATFVAFLVAGSVALVTAYSYSRWRLPCLLPVARSASSTRRSGPGASLVCALRVAVALVWDYDVAVCVRVRFLRCAFLWDSVITVALHGLSTASIIIIITGLNVLSPLTQSTAAAPPS